jgi:hypothetical protein
MQSSGSNATFYGVVVHTEIPAPLVPHSQSSVCRMRKPNRKMNLAPVEGMILSAQLPRRIFV